MITVLLAWSATGISMYKRAALAPFCTRGGASAAAAVCRWATSLPQAHRPAPAPAEAIKAELDRRGSPADLAWPRHSCERRWTSPAARLWQPTALTASCLDSGKEKPSSCCGEGRDPCALVTAHRRALASLCEVAAGQERWRLGCALMICAWFG